VVSDFTDVASWSGTVYVAFIIDVFSRLMVGWRAAASMPTELGLDALEMAVWRRKEVLDGLVCHSDAGSQYTSIRYTDRLAEVDAADRERRRQLRQQSGRVHDRAVQDRTDPPPRSLAHPGGRRTGRLGWIDWFNTRRLHGEIGHIPPAELEAIYYRQREERVAA
jgi:putative transposase